MQRGGSGSRVILFPSVFLVVYIRMTYKRYTILAAALALALPGAATAAQFSWFDEMPAKDSLGQVRTPPSLFNRDTRLAFGIGAYKSLAPRRSSEEEGRDLAYFNDATTLRFYGEVSSRPGEAIVPGVLHAGSSGQSSILGAGTNR